MELLRVQLFWKGEEATVDAALVKSLGVRRARCVISPIFLDSNQEKKSFGTSQVALKDLVFDASFSARCSKTSAEIVAFRKHL